MATTSRTRHVVLFPFPGHGHLSGFLALARLLRQNLPDAAVTLVSTPRNIAGEFRDEWLPDGFEERARAGNRGVLVRRWVPQLRILAHTATGAFLSHCGWNSVLESLSRGVPIIAWPLVGDRFYNVMLLAEEWGVCVEAARGNLETSAVERSKLAQVLETVMGETAASAAMRQRIALLRETMKSAWAEDGGSSRTALHEFLRAVHLK